MANVKPENKKTARIRFPQGVGEYEYPNPAGGGVFCLQRHIISAMRRQTPGEVYELFSTALGKPVVRQLLEETARVSWDHIQTRDDSGAVELKQTVQAWAEQFIWETPPRWFLNHAVQVLVEVARDPKCDQHLRAWETTSYARLLKHLTPFDVRPYELSPELLQHWEFEIDARYTTHELSPPAFGGRSWDPLSMSAEDYRAEMKTSLGGSFSNYRTQITAYIRAGRKELEAIVLDPQQFGQTGLNMLTTSEADLFSPHLQYRAANLLVLYVFGGLPYNRVALFNAAIRRESAENGQNPGGKVLGTITIKTITEHIRTLAKLTRIELTLGQPGRKIGHNQSLYLRRRLGKTEQPGD